MPELAPALDEAGNPVPPSAAAAAAKQSRREKKSRKAIQKLGMKPYPEAHRVTIKKSKSVSRPVPSPCTNHIHRLRKYHNIYC